MAERTEPASQKRKREAREKGQVAKSEELTAGLLLLVAAGVLAWLGPAAFTRLASLTARVLAGAPARPMAPALALRAGLVEGAAAALPGLVALAAIGGAVTLAQVGPFFDLKPLTPRLERLDPIAGLKRWFSGRALYGLAKGLVKLAIMGWILYAFLRSLVPAIAGMVGAPPGVLASTLGDAIVTLLVRGGAVLVAMGLGDLVYQRWQLGKELRMTKEEVKREHKESEGDPHHKAERSRLHREILAHSRIEDVRRADCVIVNPDHIAVAIRYDEEEMEAPQVIAKGERAIARQIIDVARAHGVPIVRDVPLARALNDLEIDDVIPEELYEAVAEVLRFAFAERDAEQEK
ncbi:MAG: EscU/YscU/HrcU family type III secretion system export apparatus switch protein [Deltaproteobacteria bacterium]|nr:EscU/YscU/HrcU family type III secretion system export apparatus switch protein [Deltaproteobacteria bacterium]